MRAQVQVDGPDDAPPYLVRGASVSGQGRIGPGAHVTKVLIAGTSGANANRMPEGCLAC
jgi:hypothetical protein